MYEGEVFGVLGLVGWLVVVEEVVIVWDVLFVEYVGSCLYVCYVLIVGLVEILWWVKVCGVDVIVEVILYYLVFIDELVCSYDLCFKVNLLLCLVVDV